MNHPSQHARLPVELIDHTISFLHNDTESLWSCTSVSHTLLRSARYHLFQTLTVGDEATENGKHGFATFLLFLEQTPEVRAYIRSLKLVRSNAPSKEQHLPVPEICSHILGKILSYLPRLHALTLGKGIHIITSTCQCPSLLTDSSNRAPRRQASVNLRLSSLSLNSVRLATPKDLSDLLMLFSEVQRFTVSDLCILEAASRKVRDGENLQGVREVRSEPVNAKESGLDITELVLDTTHAHEFTTLETLVVALGRRLHLRSLKAATFAFDHHRQVESLGTLLSRNVGDLASLTLRLPAHPYAQIPTTEWQHLRLPSFQQLKTLSFIEEDHSRCDNDVIDVFSGEANRTVCVSIKDLLHQAPRTIEQLQFCFRLRAFGTGSAGQLMDNFGWDELEETTRRCEGLKRVCFTFRGRPEGDRYLRGALKNRLAVLHARGLLQVDFEQ